MFNLVGKAYMEMLWCLACVCVWVVFEIQKSEDNVWEGRPTMSRTDENTQNVDIL